MTLRARCCHGFPYFGARVAPSNSCKASARFHDRVRSSRESDDGPQFARLGAPSEPAEGIGSMTDQPGKDYTNCARILGTPRLPPWRAADHQGPDTGFPSLTGRSGSPRDSHWQRSAQTPPAGGMDDWPQPNANLTVELRPAALCVVTVGGFQTGCSCSAIVNLLNCWTGSTASGSVSLVPRFLRRGIPRRC